VLTATSSLLLSGIAGATSEISAEDWRPNQILTTSQSKEMVDTFIDRIQNRWNITASEADYETVVDDQGVTIKPRSMTIVKAANSANSKPNEDGSGSFTQAMQVKQKAPAKQEIESSRKRIAAGVQAEPNWGLANCWTRIHYTQMVRDYPNPVGWNDTCSVGGWLPPIGGRGIWAFKMYQTCKTEPEAAQGPLMTTLTSCGISSGAVSQAGWIDWAPPADSPVGQCRSYSYGLTVGPVSASGSYNACDLLDITKNDPAGDYKIDWRGRAHDKERATQFVISFHIPEAIGPTFIMNQGMSWGLCYYPGLDQCHDTQ
jgi:hypothetical protein